MFRSFKNFELLRHQVSTRVDKSLREYAEQSKNSADKIASAIFSSCFSLAVSFVSSKFIKEDKFITALFIFLLFVFVYIVAYLLYKKISSWLEKTSYNLKRHKTKLSKREVKEYIDNFDHIACDNNLLGKEFIKKYNSEKDTDLKAFDFYELYYYTKVSADITLDILEHSALCVNTLKTSTKVDLYRIYNQLNMLKKAKDFLIANHKGKEVDMQENLRIVLASQMDDLCDKLGEIEKKCDLFLEQNFSNEQIKELSSKYTSYFTK